MPLMICTMLRKLAFDYQYKPKERFQHLFDLFKGCKARCHVPYCIYSLPVGTVSLKCLLWVNRVIVSLLLFFFYFIPYLKSIFTQEQPLELRISGLPHILLVQLCFLSVSMTTTGMCTSCLSSCQENRQSQTDKERERNSKDALTFLGRSQWRISGPNQIASFFFFSNCMMKWSWFTNGLFP